MHSTKVHQPGQVMLFKACMSLPQTLNFKFLYLKPNVVDRRYFNLRILLNQIIKGFNKLGYKDIGIRTFEFEQRLNSFDNIYVGKRFEN